MNPADSRAEYLGLVKHSDFRTECLDLVNPADCRAEYLGLVNPYAHVGRREKRKKQQESLPGGSSLTRKDIIE
jgi:hypothetical protein